MSGGALIEHLEKGVTSVCRAWALSRQDGVVMGFTDHDCALSFDGITFRPDTGLSALAVSQSSGLSVDNTEALGALCDDAIAEEDLVAGRYDGAEVRAWLVNWQDPQQRRLQFRGSIGELRHGGGVFHAELRGLSEALNRPLGRIYQVPCAAVLGDRACGVDPAQPAFEREGVVLPCEGRTHLRIAADPSYEPGWFEGGRLDVITGAARGLWGLVRRETVQGGEMEITLEQPLGVQVAAGERIRLRAGCDKRASTCRAKFDNLLNFQGFPDIPNQDWMMTHPTRASNTGGGSRR